ncbi:hypothetical protein Tco_0462584, partial [Tanacetum coccineum]
VTLFETISGQQSTRVQMQTLAQREYVDNNILDTWGSVLNHMEVYRSRESPFRMFLPMFVVIFIPVDNGGHKFLFVADLKNSRALLIDHDKNEKIVMKRVKKKIRACENLTVAAMLKEDFRQYLMVKNHTKAGNFIGSEIEVGEFDWQTNSMETEAGIFVMRHMETCMGMGMDELNCCLAGTTRKLKKQLLFLRKKYSAKILLSECNILKETMVQNASEFGKKATKVNEQFSVVLLTFYVYGMKSNVMFSLKVIKYVVPTGRVKVPAGRYVVPTGKDNVIVSAGRSKVIPAGRTILVLRDKSKNNIASSLPDDHMADFHQSRMMQGTSGSFKPGFGVMMIQRKFEIYAEAGVFGNLWVAESEVCIKCDRTGFKKPDNDIVTMNFSEHFHPSCHRWPTIVNKGGLDYLSLDELYNKLSDLEIAERVAQVDKKKSNATMFRLGHLLGNVQEQLDSKARYSAFKLKELDKSEEPKALLSIDSMLNWSDHEGEDEEKGAAQVYGMIAGDE